MSQTTQTPIFASDVVRRPARKETRYAFAAPRNARIYVSLSDKLEAYYGIKEMPDYSAPDAVWAAFNAQQVAAMTDAVARYLLDFEGLKVGVGDIKYSRKAGCSCGCSPGFIASETFTRVSLSQEDLHLTLDLGSAVVALVRAA
jgi:hypothetical protein